MTEAIEVLTGLLLAAAGLLAVARIVRDASLPDKVIGADLLIFVVAAAVAAGAGLTEDGTYLDVLVVVTSLGFIATIVVARFVEKRGTGT